MKHKSTQNTVDAFPGLSSLERQQKFSQGDKTDYECLSSCVEGLYGTITQSMRHDLLRLHLNHGLKK